MNAYKFFTPLTYLKIKNKALFDLYIEYVKFE